MSPRITVRFDRILIGLLARFIANQNDRRFLMSRTCMRYETQSKMATAELEYVPKGKDGLQPLLGILSNSKAPKSVFQTIF